MNVNEDKCDLIILVKTSDKLHAGTDANVSMQMFGENGVSDIIHLKQSQYKNKFERNQLDKFTLLNQKCIGQITHLAIWHDNTGPGANWHLEYIEICDTYLGQKFRFPCHRWLQIDKDGINTTMQNLKCLEVTTGPKYTIQVADGIPRKESQTKFYVFVDKQGSQIYKVPDNRAWMEQNNCHDLKRQVFSFLA